MKYLETINLINNCVNKLQHDIYENPTKYLKGNKIDVENINLKIINDIKSNLTPSWIDKSDFKILSNDKNIKLIANKKKRSIIYKLIDNNGHQCTIDNEITSYCKFDESDGKLILYVIFPIKGDNLEFNYILNDIINYQVINIDLSVLSTYLSLIDKNSVKYKYLELQRKM